MTAIADHSDITIWPWWVWALGLGFLVAAAIVRAIRDAPTLPAEPSHLDTLDGATWCGQRGCTGQAHITAYDTTGNAHDVCLSCFSAGTRKGYWTVSATKDGAA